MRIFSWVISAVILIGWSIGRILHPENATFPHSFFLFKHSLDILFINGALVMFNWPFLIEKGIIGPNYYDENEFGKAKMFLVLYGLFSPGFILVLISTYVTKTAYIPSSIIFVLYCYGYLKNLYIYSLNKERDEREK